MVIRLADGEICRIRFVNSPLEFVATRSKGRVLVAHVDGPETKSVLYAELATLRDEPQKDD